MNKETAMLNVEETAAFLGVKPATIRSWILLKKITYSKIGRSVRIPRDECRRIIAEGTRPATRRIA